MIVSAFIYLSVGAGIGISVLLAVVIYVVVLGWLWKKNDYYLP